MVGYSDDTENLVPFEIGIQTSETIIMWVGGTIFWLLSFILLGLAVGFSYGLFGLLAFIFGGVLVLASQFISPYDPMRTMRFPLTGLITWLFAVIFLTPILLRGWNEYLSTGTDTLVFLLVYGFLVLLATVGLLLSYYLTSMKMLKWMNQDVPTTLYVIGIISTVLGVTSVGFNNTELLDVEELSLGKWFILFLFSMSYLLFLEMNHGAHRFNEIITYARKKAVGEFNLTPVINNYYILGFILMIIVGVCVIVVLAINLFIRWIMPFINEQLANSIMMNTVYSVVFTMALVFIPLGLILLVFFSLKEQKEKEEEEEMRKKSEKESKPSAA